MKFLIEKFKDVKIRYAFYAVGASLAFGIFTNFLPFDLSQKDRLFGYGSDSEVYWDLAGNLAEGRGFVHSPGFDFAYLQKTENYTSGTQRLPAYPVALSVVRVWDINTPPNGWQLGVFNLILVFLNAYFIAGILQKLFPAMSKKIYWAIVLLPQFLIYSNGINSDFFGATMISAAVFFALLESKQRYWSAIFTVLALLTRGNALFFLVPFWVMLAVHSGLRKLNFRPAILSLGLIFLVFAAWSQRNFKLSGHFVFAPFTGFQLRQNYINKIYESQKPAGEEKYYLWQDPKYLKTRFEELAAKEGIYAAEAEVNAEMTSLTFKLLWQKKLEAAKIYARNVLQIITNEYFLFNLGRLLNSPAAWGVIWILALLLFTLPGLILLGSALAALLWRKFTLPVIIIYSASAYLLLTAAVLGDFARYTVLAGLGIIISLANLKNFIYAKS